LYRIGAFPLEEIGGGRELRRSHDQPTAQVDGQWAVTEDKSQTGAGGLLHDIMDTNNDSIK
jgi:hypothetical protein